MIRAIHDVKGIDMGNSLIRYKAEVDFDGRELTRSYLDKQDLNKLLEVSHFVYFKSQIFGFFMQNSKKIIDLLFFDEVTYLKNLIQTLDSKAAIPSVINDKLM